MRSSTVNHRMFFLLLCGLPVGERMSLLDERPFDPARMIDLFFSAASLCNALILLGTVDAAVLDPGGPASEYPLAFFLAALIVCFGENVLVGGRGEYSALMPTKGFFCISRIGALFFGTGCPATRALRVAARRRRSSIMPMRAPGDRRPALTRSCSFASLEWERLEGGRGESRVTREVEGIGAGSTASAARLDGSKRCRARSRSIDTSSLLRSSL